MPRLKVLYATVAVLALAAGGAGIHASDRHGRTLVITMTNDPNANQLRVYDAQSHVLLQTLSTHGKGGVGGNARGVLGELEAERVRVSEREVITWRRGLGRRGQRDAEREQREHEPWTGHDGPRWICCAMTRAMTP